MKILLVSESYWPNADGGALFERRLALGLIDFGHTVEIWAPSTGLHSYIEKDGNSLIHRERAIVFLANRKYKVSLWPFWHGRKIVREFDPDVVHIHNFYRIGWAGMLWAKRYKVPIVATNHFMPENALLNLRGVQFVYRPLHALIWKYLVWAHNRAQYVTSPTPTAVKLLVDHGLKAPHEAISNGIDTAVFKPGQKPSGVMEKYGIETNVPIILYVGRVDGEKRLDVLLDSLPAVLAVHPAAQLVISGFGKAMEPLKSQAKRLGIENSIIFTGFIEEEEKPLLYNCADVFAISSPAELQSIVTLEAMASGLPVVATDVAALSELCRDGQNGFLFPENDSAALSKCLIRIISDPDLAQNLGKRSREIVENEHSTNVTFERYLGAYKSAIERIK